jgi:hypothetical protein
MEQPPDGANLGGHMGAAASSQEAAALYFVHCSIRYLLPTAVLLHGPHYLNEIFSHGTASMLGAAVLATVLWKTYPGMPQPGTEIAAISSGH